MSEPKAVALIERPTSSYEDRANIDARAQWERTGLVPMDYIQSLLRQGFSNGETIAERVMASFSAGPLPEGGFQFVWDREEHHLEIDILPDHSTEWFYRNRRTGQIAGDEAPAGAALPNQLRDFLAVFESRAETAKAPTGEPR